MGTKLSNRTIFSITVVCILISALPCRGQKEVELSIRESAFHRLVVIIGEFTMEGKAGDDRRVFDVLKHDLELSGLFRVLDGQELISDWGDPGNARQKWATIGADALIEGSIEEKRRAFRLEVFVSDLASGQVMFRRTFEEPELRDVVHNASDDIVNRMTGERGIASTKIAFVWHRGGSSELHIVDYDGHNPRPIYGPGTLKVCPAWSPDDELLAFTSFVDAEPDLFLWSFEDRHARQLTRFPGLVTGASWSADAKKIAMTLAKDGNSEIYIIQRDGSRLHRVTRHPAIDCSPSWSPSGREIAFTSDRSGSPQIYVTDIDGMELRRLTFSGEYNESAAWSPKGDRIAYVAREAGFFDVWVMDPLGRHRRRLTFKGTSNEDPAWGPDGRHIVYVSTRGYTKELVLTDLSGRLEYILPLGPGDKEEPTWSP